MNEFLKNKLLYTYFTADATLPKACDREKTFFALCGLFGETDGQNLYARCSSDRVGEIDTANKYFLHLRLKTLYPENYTNAGEEEIISVKGSALVEVKELKLNVPFGNETEDISHLLIGANTGVIPAVLIYGFMLCEGLGVAPNPVCGLKYLKKAAAWNCAEANIMCLKYDGANAKEYLDRLYTVLALSPYSDTAESLAINYGVKPQTECRAELLQKLFARGLAKRGQYDFRTARMLYCEGLGISSKRKMLYSGHKDLIAAVSGLPLNLKKSTDAKYSISLPFKREREAAAIEHTVNGAEHIYDDGYRPLCISCDENYVLDAYRKAIKNSVRGANVVDIDVDAAQHLEADKNNTVITALKDKSFNILLLRFVGEIHPAKIAAACAFLKSAQRRYYKLDLGVTLNLQSVLPICFCDGQNAEALKKYCTLLNVPPLSAEERRVVFNGLLKDSRLSGGKASIEREAMEKLCSLNTDKAAEALEKALRLRGKGKITLKNIEEFIEDSRGKRVLGFGGGINDD